MLNVRESFDIKVSTP